MTAAAQKQTPAPVKRTFEFKPILTMAPPAEASASDRAPGINDLPFKGLFTEALATLKADPKALVSYFIPDEFWKGRPNVVADKVDASYGRSKIMDQWRKWLYVHKDGKNTNVVIKGHEGVMITGIYRPKGIDEKNPEPGFQFWVQPLPGSTEKSEGDK